LTVKFRGWTNSVFELSILEQNFVATIESTNDNEMQAELSKDWNLNSFAETNFAATEENTLQCFARKLDFSVGKKHP
jgi:hypothetical protein